MTLLVISEAGDDLLLHTVTDPAVTEVGRVKVATSFHATAHPSAHIVYLTSDVDGGSVVAIDPATLDRTTVSGLGGLPCYVEVAPDGRSLAVACYDGGTVALVDLDSEGRLGGIRWRTELPAPTDDPGRDPERQDQSRPHSAVFTGDGLLVADLGTDIVWRLDLDSGEATDAYHCPIGSGPRHLTHGPDERWWVSLELSSEIGLLCDTVLTTRAARPCPEARNYPGDIVTAGTWVVVANRGADTLGLVDANRTVPGHAIEIPAGGRWPSSLVVAGDQVVVALRESEQVAFFDITDAGLTLVRTIDCPRPIALALLAD